MRQILLHLEVLNDIKLCKKKWYPSLGIEMPRVYRYLMKNGMMPGETPVHYIKLNILQGRTFHAKISLPQEGISGRKGGRIIYVKESVDLIKIIYVGGHKDRRYDNPFAQVSLIESRYQTESYLKDFEF